MKVTTVQNPAHLINSIFDSFIQDLGVATPAQLSNIVPKTNILENDTQFEIQMLAPGYSKDQILIKVEEGTLWVESKLEAIEEAASKPNFKRKEFVKTAFKKSFKLPEVVDVETVNGVLEHGILSITLPKKAQAAKFVKEISLQ
jgi:HSP20 family protein